MAETRDAVEFFLDQLSSHHFLAGDDRAAFVGLRALSRYHEPAKYLQREGDLNSELFSVIAEGHAFGQKIAEDGKRQIISLLMPGDTIDGHQLFLRSADHNVQALTRLQTVEISRADVQRVAFERPAVGRALWMDALKKAAVMQEWLVNVACRDARHRIARLLCEFVWRASARALSIGAYHEFPMTQAQIGDATGLTSVHVCRTLRTLAAEGLIIYHKRQLRIYDVTGLAAIGSFSRAYLHLPDEDLRPSFSFR